jgi:HK97 family phage prohead protease
MTQTAPEEAGLGMSERAVWTTAYVNNLPDSAFLYVEPGGRKDGDGKTVPRTLRHFPYKDDSGAVDLPHLRNALARIPQSSLPAGVKATLTAKAQRLLANANNANGGRDGRVEEYRALPRAYELRDDGNAMPTLVGTLAVFDEAAEIRSTFEGHFLERIAPTAFNKTIQENRDAMRVLFQHGKDPQIGDKPLGPIRDITIDERAAHYEVELLDTSYNRDLIALFKADPPVLGSSFRFEVIRDDWKRNPGKSAGNPRGLDERLVQEIRMSEFGPVTFPAYKTTSVGLRSLTDRMLLGTDVRLDAEGMSTLAQMIELGSCYIEDQDEPGDEANIPRMEAILAAIAELIPYEVGETEPAEMDEENSGDPAADAPSTRDAAQSGTSRKERRDRVPALYGQKGKEKPKWRL